MNPALLPKKKVAVGGIGGALATLVVWAAGAFGGVAVAPEAAGALATLFGFVCSYFKND